MAKYVADWSSALYGTGLNFSMNCSGVHRALLVFIYVDTASDVLTDARYDGVSLTLEAKIAAAGVHRMYVYSMLNPPTGSLTLLVSLDNPYNLHVHAITLEGINQSGDPFGSVVWSEATSMSPSRVVNSNGLSIVIDTVGYLDDTVVPTEGSGQTKIIDTEITSATRAASSWEKGADPSVTMSWSLSSSAAWLLGTLSVQGVPKKKGNALLIL